MVPVGQRRATCIAILRTDPCVLFKTSGGGQLRWAINRAPRTCLALLVAGSPNSCVTLALARHGPPVCSDQTDRRGPSSVHWLPSRWDAPSCHGTFHIRSRLQSRINHIHLAWPARFRPFRTDDGRSRALRSHFLKRRNENTPRNAAFEGWAASPQGRGLHLHPPAPAQDKAVRPVCSAVANCNYVIRDLFSG